MRKLLICLAVFSVSAVTLPSFAAAAPAPSEQELLVVKKKKAEAQRKAEAAKKAEAQRKLDVQRKAQAVKKAKAKSMADAKARLAAEKKLVQKKIALLEKKQQQKRAAAATRSDCGGLLQCLFGKKRPRSGVQMASTGNAGIDMSTAENVSWAPAAKYPAGSIVVQTPERALYLVLGDGKARRYKVGVGRDGFQWSGNSRIVNKAEWPTWRPPQVMIEREAAKGHFLPDVMEGGPDNPLGARAMYIGGTMYRIHGTNNAGSIGGAVSSGCIRMMNTDVVDLYDRVKVGASVHVYQ
jgi:lipoprotein-anchoring transpeptidase ErfK/SrfK